MIFLGITLAMIGIITGHTIGYSFIKIHNRIKYRKIRKLKKLGYSHINLI